MAIAFLLLCAYVYLYYISFDFLRVKFIIEEIEREEAALREDLYSADRKFAEYYNVWELSTYTAFYSSYSRVLFSQNDASNDL